MIIGPFLDRSLVDREGVDNFKENPHLYPLPQLYLDGIKITPFFQALELLSQQLKLRKETVMLGQVL